MLHRLSIFLSRIFLLVGLIILFAVILPYDAYGQGIPAGYSLIAENSNLRLYVDEESLAVILEERGGGHMLRSAAFDTEGANPLWAGFMRSGFAMEFFNDRAAMPERLDAFGGNPIIHLERVGDGFNARIYYERQEISFEIQVRLTSEGMTAAVPASSIQEPENIRISAIYLYHFMGAALPEETEGYMFIPEGTGALIDLSDNNRRFRSPYRKRIFGRNVGIDGLQQLRQDVTRREPLPVLMPIYGIVHTSSQTAFLAIAEEGEFNAEILAYPNGVVTAYNWAAIRFIYREQFAMQTSRTTGILTSESVPYLRDLKMRFVMLTGDEADYSGLAKVYRSFLDNRGYLPSRDVGFNTRLDFLGAESQKWLLFDRVVTMTTANQMEAMLKSLTDSGVGNILALYRGWQRGGLSKNLGTGNFNMERQLGRFRDLNRIQNSLPNVLLTLHQDFLLANAERSYNTNINIVKGINQMLVNVPTNAEPYESMYYFTPRRMAQLVLRFARHTAASFPLSMGSVGDTLFSFYSRGGVSSRGSTAVAIQDAIAPLDNGGFAMEAPFTYMLPYTNAFLDMPLTTSGYNYILAEIPFLPMVLSSKMPMYAEYANFQANTTRFFLKMVEYGVYPSFLLTGESPENLRRTNSSWVYVSGFDIFHERIISYSEELGALHRQIGGSPVHRHDIVSPGVARTTYENGVLVIVNYNTSPFTLGGLTIGGESYAVTGSNAVLRRDYYPSWGWM